MKLTKIVLSLYVFFFSIGMQVLAEEISVQDNIVTSLDIPLLAIKVSPEFRFIGRHPIHIRDVAAGERLIFMDQSKSAPFRLFILQFEGFNDGVEGRYNYNLSNSPVVAGYPWRSNAYAFNLSESIQQSPGAESSSTADFLNTRKIPFPDGWMMWRSLTVTDEDRRSELILFYIENVQAAGQPLSSFYDEEGNSTEFWRSLMPAIERRANASFSLSHPKEKFWQSIPRYFDR